MNIDAYVDKFYLVERNAYFLFFAVVIVENLSRLLRKSYNDLQWVH